MKNKSQLRVLIIIKAMMMGSIFGNRNKNVKAEFPIKIGNYSLQKIFNKKEIKSRVFLFALYENDKGEKAIAKMWKGNIKDFMYYTLLNEIAVYRTLNKVLTRLSNSIPQEFKEVNIPKFLGSLESKNNLIILTEYIDGETAEKFSSEQAFRYYKKSSNFLRFLGNKMTKKEKEEISSRTALKIILLYPFLLITAITTHPHLFGMLMKGLLMVLSSLPAFFKKGEISLGHRDLQPKNILNAKGAVYIVDLQFCIFSHELYDLFTTLRASFSDKSFRNKIIEEFARRLLQGEDKNWIRGLMIICATHGLSGNNLPKRIEKKYINFLNFAVKKSNYEIHSLSISNKLRFTN